MTSLAMCSGGCKGAGNIVMSTMALQAEVINLQRETYEFKVGENY